MRITKGLIITSAIYLLAAVAFSMKTGDLVVFVVMLIGYPLIPFISYLKQLKQEEKNEKKVPDIKKEQTDVKKDIPASHNFVSRIPLREIRSIDEIRSKHLPRFIAFDVETTGLDPTKDRIVEYSAVLFENGKPASHCTTLVNSGKQSSPSALSTHGITDEMLKDAYPEKTAITALVKYLDDALFGGTPIVCHNAEFDLAFLSDAIIRLGIAQSEMNIVYIDTMHIAQRYLEQRYNPELTNYKLGTLKELFGVEETSHRAQGDAIACGQILCMFPAKVDEQQAKIDTLASKRTPTTLQMDFCGVIRDIIGQTGYENCWLKFVKVPGGVNINNFWNFFSLSFTKNTVSASVPHSVAETSGLPYDDVSLDPAYEGLCKVYFTSPADLYKLSDHITNIFTEVLSKTIRYYEQGSRQEERLEEYENDPTSGHSIAKEEMHQILERIGNTDYSWITVPVKEPIYDRASIEITPSVTLKSFTPVRMTEASKQKLDVTIENADSFRKDGNYQAGADLLLKSRSKGHISPKLYDTLARIYHAAKEYDNEIAVLDEGIRSCSFGLKIMERRRDDAIDALMKQRDKQ